MQNRKWMAERLRARGLPHDDRCCLCDQQLETSQHLALQCPYAKEVWAKFQSTNPKASYGVRLMEQAAAWQA
jgi:hypothetical protein